MKKSIPRSHGKTNKNLLDEVKNKYERYNNHLELRTRLSKNGKKLIDVRTNFINANYFDFI